jgi:hypothetical protein
VRISPIEGVVRERTLGAPKSRNNRNLRWAACKELMRAHAMAAALGYLRQLSIGGRHEHPAWKPRGIAHRAVLLFVVLSWLARLPPAPAGSRAR